MMVSVYLQSAESFFDYQRCQRRHRPAHGRCCATNPPTGYVLQPPLGKTAAQVFSLFQSHACAERKRKKTNNNIRYEARRLHELLLTELEEEAEEAMRNGHRVREAAKRLEILLTPLLAWVRLHYVPSSRARSTASTMPHMPMIKCVFEKRP